MKKITRYFPNLSENKALQFSKLPELYRYWNSQINVVSRKDIDELLLRHVLHSLGIAMVQKFRPGSKILDIGTGGGFPGIPLAIMFPETHFHLVDSIGKKIKVVDEVVESLGLENVTTAHIRAEKVQGRYDFIVSRAVTRMSDFVKWTPGKIAKENKHDISNGILYLKGGDLSDELKGFKNVRVYELKNFYFEDFFDTKKVVHLPLMY